MRFRPRPRRRFVRRSLLPAAIRKVVRAFRNSIVHFKSLFDASQYRAFFGNVLGSSESRRRDGSLARRHPEALRQSLLVEQLSERFVFSATLSSAGTVMTYTDTTGGGGATNTLTITASGSVFTFSDPGVGAGFGVASLP